jgi:hypothetical protein
MIAFEPQDKPGFDSVRYLQFILFLGTGVQQLAKNGYGHIAMKDPIWG